MKKLLLVFALSSVLLAQAQTEQVTIGDKNYDINTLIDRDLGPGVRYTRLRIPDYPLNVNMLRIDVTNPYNRVETTQASDKLYGTESLVNAASRQTSTGHVALAGANANFWCVSGQPPFSDQLIGLTYNGNLKNGKIITETNMFSDQWNGGWEHTGIVGVTPDGKAVSGHYKWAGNFTSSACGTVTINCFNKTLRDNEITAYNSYYGTSRTFRCVDQAAGTDGKQHFTVVTGVATEVYLTLDAGSKWSAGNDIAFTVKEIRKNAGDGTVGNYDLVIVGRGTQKEVLEKLSAGDKVTLKYHWTDANDNPIVLDNLVGGNAQVMVAGELTKFNTSESYNSQVYSRTGYGVDKDGKTLYIIVIDKSTDPVYGSSKGCSTTDMCAIAKHYGVWDMTNFDAGGSAEMLVEGAIINKTTEGSPRAVANGMIVYSVAPEDNVITRLEFADDILQAPIYGTFAPKFFGFNQYGALVSKDVEGVTLSCPAEAGSCDGSVFYAGNKAGKYALTASLGNVSVTKDIEILEGQIAFRFSPILLDAKRTYNMEVKAAVGDKMFDIDRSSVEWSIDDPTVATISDDGVLKPVAQGTTTVRGRIGEFTNEAVVNVEVPSARYLPVVKYDNISEWKHSGSGTKNRSLARAGENGIAITYTVSNTRSTYVTVRPVEASTMYSLPDSVRIVINPADAKVTKLRLKFGANGTNPGSKEYDVTLNANTDNVLLYPMADFIDINDLINYPVVFTDLSVVLGDDNATTHTITIPNIDGVYTSYEGTHGVGTIGIDSPEADEPASYYNLQGVKVGADRLAPGLYIRVRGNKADKILVR